MITKTNELSERKLRALSALAAVLIGWLCWHGTTIQAQTPATQSPQVQEIVKLTQAKMSDDVILSYIKNSGATYNLSADDILYLNTQGVSQAVIAALLQNKSAAPAPVPQPLTPAPQQVPVTQPVTVAPPQASPYPQQVSPYPTPAPTVAPTVETPPPGSEMSLGYFQTQLAPYGAWVDVPGYGQCWVPSVQNTVADWRPYFNAGHWVYSDSGWSWQSDYPWGEYVFHYGRWMRDPHFGWVWVPGYTWGPAWVSWRQAEAEGYCGWAPLGPDVTFQAGVGFFWHGHLVVDGGFDIPPDMFVFIPFDRFWAPDYVLWRAPFGRVPFLFRASILANHFSFVGGRFVFEGIGRDRIALLTHHEVRLEHLMFHDPHIMHSFDVGHGHDGFLDRGHDRDFHDHHFP